MTETAEGRYFRLVSIMMLQTHVLDAMEMDFLRFEIITDKERNSVITTVKDAITSVGGWIIDHQFLSNASASINFEVGYRDLDQLIEKLEAKNLKPEIINDCARDKDGDLRCGVALIFIHNEPDLKREVPPFG